MNKTLIILDFMRPDMFVKDQNDSYKFNLLASDVGKTLAWLVMKQWKLSFNDISIRFLYPKIPNTKKGTYVKPKVKEFSFFAEKLRKNIFNLNPSLIIAYGSWVKDTLVDKRLDIAKYELQKINYTYQGKNLSIVTSFNPSLALYKNLGLSSKIDIGIENKFIKRFINGNYDIKSLEPKFGKYEHIKDFNRVKEVFEKEIPKHKIVALDFETNTLDVWREGAKAILVSISWKEHQGITIPISHKKYPNLWTKDQYNQLIKYILNLVSSKQWVVMHNGMYDIYMLMKIYGLKRAVNIVDTLIMYYIGYHEVVLDRNGKPILRNLKQLAYEFTDMGGYENNRDIYFNNLKKKWFDDWYAKESKILEEQARKDNKKPKLPSVSNYKEPVNEIDGGSINFEWLPLDIIEPYAAADTDVTLQLYNIFVKRIKKNPKWIKLIFEFYPKLEDAVCYMQSVGVKMDKNLLVKYGDIYSKYRDKLIENMRIQVPEIKEFEKKRLELLNKRSAIMSKYKPKDRTDEQKAFIAKIGTDLRGTDSKGVEKWKFTPSSGKKVGYILYHMLGYELPIDKEYIKKGSWGKIRNPEKITWNDFSTSGTALEYIAKKFNSAFATSLIEYSRINKLITSFIDAYPKKLDKDGYIHPKFNVIGTKTGRLSSSNPKQLGL